MPVFVGTDAGGSLPHGLVAARGRRARHGRPAPDVARSTPRAGARARGCGRPGLEEGAPADLVVYPADPRTDVAVLAAPSLVVLRGRPTTP